MGAALLPERCRRNRDRNAEMTEIDNPFDGEAARLFHQQGVTEQQARDDVALRYLKVGDTRWTCRVFVRRSKRSFRPLGARRPMGFFLPMLNADDAGYGSR
jgi:hypothetical protein